MLTVKQKINMLVLAGYEPYVYSPKWRQAWYPIAPQRVIKGRCCLLGPEKGIPWEFVATFDPNVGRYTKSTWPDMRLDTCPDELIYEAMEAS